MYQREKENTIRNSKLQMSIKPFVLCREDLGKSKSVDKTKKGISRVIQTHTNSASTLQATPFTYNFHSSQAQTTQQRINNPLTATQQPFNSQVLSQNANARAMDLMYKAQLLQKQLVVVEKQNAEIAKEMAKWKQKCTQLFSCNKELNKKIEELEERFIYKNKCLEDKQQHLRQKQMQIQDLMSKNQNYKTDQSKMNELYDKIRQLSIQLQRSTSRNSDLERQKLGLIAKIEQNSQRQIIRTKQVQSNTQIQQLLRTIEQYKQQKIDRTESYRQLLIKNSMLTQDKQNLQSKIKSLAYQLSCEEQKTRKVMASIDQLEQDLKSAEQEAVLARAFRKQLEHFDQIKLQNNELHIKLRQFQLKIKQLDQRRLNQIQFHQEQMRRVSGNESHKYESIIQAYKHQRDQAIKELNLLRNTNKQSEIKKMQIIDNMNKEYQTLVLELKGKITDLISEKDSLHNKYQQQLKQKEKQINELMNKLNDIREDNNFLINKIGEQKSKINITAQANYRSRSPVKKSKQASPSNQKQGASFKSNYLQIKTLDEKNKQINKKISEYEVQFIKLQDKIHILQIDAEKSKSEQQINQRKMKHLTQQIEHYKTDKNKTIEQKIKLVEQVQSLKLQMKNREIDMKGLQQKSKQYSQRIEELSVKQKQYKQLIQELSIKIQAQSEMIVGQRIELDSAKEKKQQLQRLTSTNTKIMQKINDELIAKQAQIKKYKQCIGMIKQQNALNRQKLLVKQYMTQKQECEQKQGRLSMYKQYFIILGAELNVGQFSENEVLGMLNKLIRASIQKKIQLQMKVTKMEIQYKQLIQTENATRLLVQKYQEKCLQLEKLLIRMEEAHNQKILLVKQDYDVVYAKYLKYRNIVVSNNLQRDKEKYKK